MNHMLPGQMNEFVLIQRGPDGCYAVEYGPRDPSASRYVCSDFKSVAEAIEWVDRLDQSIFGFGAPASAASDAAKASRHAAKASRHAHEMIVSTPDENPARPCQV